MKKTEEAEKNHYEALETAGELYGFIFHKEGAAGLWQTLNIDPNDYRAELEERGLWPPPLRYREYYITIADELSAAGMKQAAKIVRKYAQKLPLEIDTCPYEKGSTDERAWLSSMWQDYGRCYWCGDKDKHGG